MCLKDVNQERCFVIRVEAKRTWIDNQLHKATHEGRNQTGDLRASTDMSISTVGETLTKFNFLLGYKKAGCNC